MAKGSKLPEKQKDVLEIKRTVWDRVVKAAHASYGNDSSTYGEGKTTNQVIEEILDKALPS